MIPESSRKIEAEEKYNQLIKEHEVIAFIDGFAFENQESDKILKEAV